VKRISANKLLGIAIGPQGLLIAELARTPEGHKVLRAAVWAYPDGLSPDQPQALGQSLATFLCEQGVTAHDVVVGLPAKWLVTRRRDLPPASPDMVAGNLRLFAETEFSSELKDLAIDYAGEPNPAAPSSVLLAGTHRDRIDQCVAIAKAAKLRLRGITVTGAALAWLSHQETSAKGVVLSLAPIGAELIIQRDGVPWQLRHLTLTNGEAHQSMPVINELRRTMASLPAGEDSRFLSIWADEPSELQAAVKEKLGISATVGRMRSADATEPVGCAPAVAIAVAALQGNPGTIDFLHTRLAPPKAKSNRRPLMWAAALAATAIIGMASAYWDLRQQQTYVSDTKAGLDDNAQAVRRAQTALRRLETARDWMSGKVRFTACFADLTALFPDEGSVWATSLSLKSDMAGQLAGKASSEQQVLALLDKMMKDNKRFINPTLIDMRDAGRNSHEIAFSISFTYRPVE
jgi:hypothetical protein